MVRTSIKDSQGENGRTPTMHIHSYKASSGRLLVFSFLIAPTQTSLCMSRAFIITTCVPNHANPITRAETSIFPADVLPDDLRRSLIDFIANTEAINYDASVMDPRYLVQDLFQQDEDEEEGSYLPAGQHGAFIKIDPQVNSVKITVVPIWSKPGSGWSVLPTGPSMASELSEPTAYYAVATDDTKQTYQPSVVNKDGLFKFLPECPATASANSIHFAYYRGQLRSVSIGHLEEEDVVQTTVIDKLHRQAVAESLGRVDDQ